MDLEFFSYCKSCGPIPWTHGPWHNYDSPVYHGPATTSGVELTGDGHAASSRARGLGLTTLGEKGDHRGPHRVPQWVMQWWRWPSDEG
jgi:hypothetical protein